METSTGAASVATLRTGPRPWALWILLGVIAALILGGVVVALVAGRQDTATYPPKSPQATVQRYFRLLQGGQVDAAYKLTHMNVSRQRFHSEFDSWTDRSHRVTLVSSGVYGAHASVKVDISTFSGGPYGSSDNTNRSTIALHREGGKWRIVGPEYLPW